VRLPATGSPEFVRGITTKSIVTLLVAWSGH
jgi:hypothetical protein